MKTIKSLDFFSNLSPSEHSYLESLLTFKEVSKNQIIISQGDLCKKLFFLNKGIMSSNYSIKGKDFVRDFYFKNQIFTAQESFYKQQPARFSIKSLTKASLQEISFENLELAFEEIPSLRKEAYDLLMNGFINISNRLEFMLTLKPEERYKKLLNESPGIFNVINLKVIASYLGITDVALSRIRKRIASPKKNIS